MQDRDPSFWDDVNLLGGGMEIDGGRHALCENQHDIILGWIGCFRLGARDAPRFTG